MATAIATAVGTLLALVFWLWKREAGKRDDPIQQNEKRREEIAREVIHRDPEAINRSLDDDLNRLQDLQGHQPGQGSGSTKGG